MQLSSEEDDIIDRKTQNNIRNYFSSYFIKNLQRNTAK